MLPEDPVPELPPIDVTTDLAEQAVEPETDIVLDDQTIAADEAGNATDLDKGSDTGTEKDNLETAEKPADDNQPEPEVSDDSKVLTDTENKAGIVPSAPEQETEPLETTETTTDAGNDDLVSSSVPIPKASKNLTRPDESLSAFYRVQLAAFKDEGKAMQVAAILMNKHISRLDQISIGVMLHDAGEQGLFWRVVTDPMPRANASKLCNTLKSVGQECILRPWN